MKTASIYYSLLEKKASTHKEKVMYLLSWEIVIGIFMMLFILFIGVLEFRYFTKIGDQSEQESSSTIIRRLLLLKIRFLKKIKPLIEWYEELTMESYLKAVIIGVILFIEVLFFVTVRPLLKDWYGLRDDKENYFKVKSCYLIETAENGNKHGKIFWHSLYCKSGDVDYESFSDGLLFKRTLNYSKDDYIRCVGKRINIAYLPTSKVVFYMEGDCLDK
jgi:hypothetical protein